MLRNSAAGWGHVVVPLVIALAPLAGCDKASEGKADALGGDASEEGKDTWSALPDGGFDGSDDSAGGTGDAAPAIPTAGCHPATAEELAPGVPIVQLDTPGAGACAGKTLADVIAQIYAGHPELSDIQAVFAPGDGVGDGSFIYPNLGTDGGFSLVLKRGLGDCPSGCTENFYFYFATDGGCVAEEVGHYLPMGSANGDCSEPDGTPMWGRPLPLDPIHLCGSDNSPQPISGTYQMIAVGRWDPCAESGDKPKPVDIAAVVTIVLWQNPEDPGVGTVTVDGTGHPLVEGKSFPAEFIRKRFRAVEAYDNLPSTCPQEHNLVVEYDFECFQAGQVLLNEYGSETCAECKGYMQLALDEVVGGE